MRDLKSGAERQKVLVQKLGAVTVATLGFSLAEDASAEDAKRVGTALKDAAAFARQGGRSRCADIGADPAPLGQRSAQNGVKG